jgi:hypothetical protein
VLHTNKTPVLLRVDIRNPDQNTGLDDCERMSHALEPTLDEIDIILYAYVLEVSSPVSVNWKAIAALFNINSTTGEIKVNAPRKVSF